MHTFNLGTLEITLLISMTRRLKTICGLKQWKYIKWQTIKNQDEWGYQWNIQLENSRRKNILKTSYYYFSYLYLCICLCICTHECRYICRQKTLHFLGATLMAGFCGHSLSVILKNLYFFLCINLFSIFCSSTKPMANTTTQPYLWSTSLWFSIHNTDNLKIKNANIINKVSNTKFNDKVIEKTVECDKERKKKRWRNINFRS